MNVFDCFLFCHEVDMLELRLRLLYDSVDKFIILESDHTFMNKPKPIYYDPERFSWAKDKIIYKLVSGPIDVPIGDIHLFYVERVLRQRLYDYAKEHSRDRKDIIMLSDLDEFPSREGIDYLKNNKFSQPHYFKQDLYWYNIGYSMKMKWKGTLAFYASYDIHSVKSLKSNFDGYEYIEDGWHFTYFMTPKDIVTKLESFSHAAQYDHDDYIRHDVIQLHIDRKTNFLGKRGGEVEPKPLPDYLLKELSNYPLFMGSI